MALRRRDVSKKKGSNTVTSSSKSTSTSQRWERYLTKILIVVGLLLIIWFGMRSAVSAIRVWRTGLQPGVTDVEALRGWMTIPYIARAFGVPEEYLFEALGIPVGGNRRKSLGKLNREYTPGERGVILKRLKAAIRRYQAEQPARTRGAP
jgi:hypothetical protein